MIDYKLYKKVLSGTITSKELNQLLDEQEKMISKMIAQAKADGKDFIYTWASIVNYFMKQLKANGIALEICPVSTITNMVAIDYFKPVFAKMEKPLNTSRVFYFDETKYIFYEQIAKFSLFIAGVDVNYYSDKEVSIESAITSLRIVLDSLQMKMQPEYKLIISNTFDKVFELGYDGLSVLNNDEVEALAGDIVTKTVREFINNSSANGNCLLAI